MKGQKILEIPIAGMDCADCTRHVQKALSAVPGVRSVEVFLATEKAVVQFEEEQVDLPALQQAVTDAGYSVLAEDGERWDDQPLEEAGFTRQIRRLTAVVFLVVLFLVIAGEWLGLFERITEVVPWYLGLIIVGLAGYPIFRKVVSTSLRRQVTSHTLMTMGVLAALVIGEWLTALIVVFFMRVGDYIEHKTANNARRAFKNLALLAPQVARVERDGIEVEVRIAEVKIGETVIVRPGEKIPVDGEVTAGQAIVDQSMITGELMPVEVGPGAQVYAASLSSAGSVKLLARHVGLDTTFGQVIRLVEEAEVNRAEVQSLADRFSGYFLPIVATIALLTLIVSRDPLATAAVLVVACSCSIALATPIAMLASIGAAAGSGLLIKGGKYIEALDRSSVLLIDKTGTLTLGKPQVTDIVSLNGMSQDELLQITASVEKYSEHPLAEAVRSAARSRQLILSEPDEFVSMPGLGIRGRVNGRYVTIGNTQLLRKDNVNIPSTERFKGKTIFYIAERDTLMGFIAVADTLRLEVPEALERLREIGITQIELITGDNEQAAAILAEPLGIRYRANLLPEEKITVVKAYQEQGFGVIMVGDGINDAPALAQADVGIAMGVAGSDIAIEAAHVALMREDWGLIPELMQIAHRTMRIVRLNLGFTAVYNVLGISLAALGFLPPALAAAAQSLPDLGILANSSRLLKHKPRA